ncbi:hypothetical protein BD410DRAFT_900025 [Rickenella mellea]|uniref:Beta-glucuronidase C-terminal domain-containing protein n=1 Tax=Rickenella mellea TaxID=50990 RepID=A0A4Y7PWA5_9AGAM|nr:hypothetical protein BD410DRAFT_900025 [Rickenella mellea]
MINVSWSLLFIQICAAVLAASAQKPASVSIPNTLPKTNSSIGFLDTRFLGLSIEFSSTVDFGGEPGQVNQFTAQCMSGLSRTTGLGLRLRIGGSTENHFTYHENQTTAINATWGSNPDQPSHVDIGPGYWTSLNQIGGGRIVLGLSGEDTTPQEQAGVAVAALSAVKHVEQIEVGNEVQGHYANVSAFVQDMHYYYNNITVALKAAGKSKLKASGWNGTTVFEAGDMCCDKTFFAAGLIGAGINNVTGDYRIGSISSHDYAGSACSGSIPIPLSTLMSHATNVKHIVGRDTGDIAAAQAAKIPWAQGETNSISCQGAAGTSDTFAASIWTLDWALILATRGAARVNFHSGTNYRYAPWQPILINTTEAHVRPNYAAMLAFQEFIGASGKASIAEIPVAGGDSLLAAYAVYESNVPARVVLIDTNIYNTSPSAAPASAFTNFTLTLPTGVTQAMGKRLTAPGADAFVGSWAGHTYQTDCSPATLPDVVETYAPSDGAVTVSVRHSEAVVISFK